MARGAGCFCAVADGARAATSHAQTLGAITDSSKGPARFVNENEVMKTQRLGNSDLLITPIGFGAWAIGGPGWEFGWGAQDDRESIAAIRAALDAGVPLRDVQLAARHEDPRTTTIYDRGRANFDRHAAYVVVAFVAGG